MKLVALHAIALAPTKIDDGLLTALELLDKLNLNVELVLFSACDTGRGKITEMVRSGYRSL